MIVVHLLGLLCNLQLCLAQQPTEPSTNFDRQAIAVLENRPDLIEAAEFLYMKHPSKSDIVVWDAKTGNFYRYDPEIQLRTDQVIENEYEGKNRIQVVGHGDLDNPVGGGQITLKLSGFTGNEIGQRVSKLVKIPENGGAANLGKISLVGCELAPKLSRSTPAQHPSNIAKAKFLKDVIGYLTQHQVDTEVTARSQLVAISPSGQKLLGEHKSDGTIEWRSKETLKTFINYKWRAFYDKKASRPVIRLLKNLHQIGPSGDPPDQDMHTGIMSDKFGEKGPGVLVHHIDKNKTPTKSERVKPDIVYSLVDHSAKNVYGNLGSSGEPDTETVVIRKDIGTNVDGYWARNVRKITGTTEEFMTELKRRAERYQNHEEWKPIDNPTNDDYLYYRYGEWVYSMQKNTFYIKLEGVVASEFTPKGFRDQKVEINRAALVRELANQNKPNLKHESVSMENVPDDYPSMNKKVRSDFIKGAKNWMYGHTNQLQMPTGSTDQIAQSYEGQMTLAMFLSESIRNFRNHLTNVLGMDLAEKGFCSQKEFIEKHPMARSGTWQERMKNRKKVGLEPKGLRFDPKSPGVELPNPPRERMTEFLGTWLSRMKASSDLDGNFAPGGENTLIGSLKKAGWDKVPVNEIDDLGKPFRTLRNNLQERMSQLDHTGDYTRFNSKLVSDESTYVKETEATVNDVDFDHHFSDEIAPTTFSSYLASDQDLINKKIEKEVQQIKDQYPDKEVEIDLESIKVKENEVSFDVVWDKSAYPPSEGRSEKTVQIDEKELLTKEKLDEFHERTNVLKESGALEGVNKGLSIYGTVMGLKGSIQALQRGDIPHGMVTLSQSLHGIGELTEINRKVYSVGKKLLGNVLDKTVKSLENTVLEGLSSELRSSITRFGELIEDVPIVGTAFGIYNIVEDFQQHSVLGYIDAELDIAITGLSFLGPEADIITVPLTIIRMSIDELFGNIHIDKSLPLDAQIRQFFEQFGRNILHWFESMSPIVNIINTISECKKLDAEYDKEQDFLEELEDYHNYYDVVNDGSTIDFTDGVDAQYGGSIVFELGENGQAKFSYVAEIIDGEPKRETRHITLEPYVTDIVLGMGETLKITTKEESVKLFGLITVDSHRIINDTIKDKKSLHGTYHGNSMDNNFYCVQDQPPDLPYNVSEYHYEVYGHAGNDKFMLGPQHTYVEGGAGSDTMYIHKRGSLVTINNYAVDMSTDYAALYAKYDDLEFHRQELDLVIYIKSDSPSVIFDSRSHLFSSAFEEMFGTSTSFGHSNFDEITHVIRIQNWYKDVTYQHMHFSTTDGVSFRMTIDKEGKPQTVILGLDLVSRSEGQTVSDYPSCSAIVGSNFSDSITGNKLNNHIEGGKGDDFIKGMDGVDMYIIRSGDGTDTLDNFAMDNETDVLFLMESHTHLEASASGDDLVITSNSGNTGVIIKKWLSGNPQYLHLQLVDEDGVVLKMPTDRSDMKLTVLYLDTSLTGNTNPDLTKEDLRDVTDVMLAESYHTVIANSQDNTIYAPEGSYSINGNFGSNTYVLGGETKNNYIDMSESSQLIMANIKGEFGVEFGNDVIIRKKGSSDMFVQLRGKHSMTDKIFNITTVRSYGIVFRLERDPNYRAQAVPIMLDLSSGEIYWPLNSIHNGEWYDIDMTLTDAQRLIGPPYIINIRCNDNGNYIDPGEGGSYVLSGYGPDTFVIKPNYGKSNIIRIIDYSSKVDTLLFLVPYDGITLETDDTDPTVIKIKFSSDSFDVQVEVQVLKQFPVINLLVISSDGITAELRGSLSEGYSLVPIQINRAKDDGQTVNLTSSDEWNSVVSVYGSKDHSNHLTGNSGNNTLVGGDLPDTLMGMEGDDTLKGGAGDDHLYGGDQNDLLLAGKGNDYMYGEEDNDVFVVPISGNHYVDGGNGSDTVACVTHGGCTVSLKNGLMYSSSKPGEYTVTLNDVENVIGTPDGDSLEGNGADNTLTGLGGDDLLIPVNGSDSLTGGEGSDTYYLVAEASGFSSINNFAKDKKRDIINVVFPKGDLFSEMCEKERWRDLLVRKRVSDNLIIRWLSTTDVVFFDDYDAPRISIHNWYNGEDYQHLCLQFCDGIRLCDSELTPPEEDFANVKINY